MNKTNLLYCATDKEIYDALMSAKRKINEKVILELAKDRGIFYSPKESRESLINNLSLLPHDYHDLNMLLEQREQPGRAEKLTSVTLNTELTPNEIKEVIREYSEESSADEKVTHHGKGADQVIVNVKYSEVDYGKTRLVQRTPREAGIEFHVEASKTVIRMPANERVKEIFSKIKDKLDNKKKAEIPEVRIEISEFTSPELRTEFFTSLISSLKGFKPENVTSVKVEKLREEADEDELELEDDQNTEEAKQEALSLVKNVVLKGDTLFASEEYQSLIRKGFYITSIIWRSKSTTAPNPIIEFEAAFGQPEIGKDFKYFVRGCYNVVNEAYTKTIRPLDPAKKEEYLNLIEKTAEETIEKLRKKAQDENIINAAEGTHK